ncbi:glycosyl transferase [Acaromyces ingoldii]|uniref:Glycosyl transferase n=1 Tax=Acaromyces ingoldii TaxID=215250 RepID=A0A316YF46_9BASI|nr:glycosyl transferase [Acaromyces ingoldii]PWN87731.1 glycosyl transferase [Acaromyces ingoldii]
MAGISFLEGLGRRPQRLIGLAVVFLVILSFSTWLTLSPTGYDSVRSGFSQHLPSSWGASAGAGSASGLVPSQDLADLYTHNPGKPTTAEELAKWATKGKDGNIYPPTFVPQAANQAPRAKAGFIVLVRNQELESMMESMKEVEFRFNRKYGYPWIFLNNEPFSDEFKKGVRQMTRSEIRFGLVPKEHWSYPDWIDQSKAAETRRKMREDKIIYGDSESYRHMCRFQSGFFFRHPLTMDLEYYWRVEPGIKLFCDIDYDPFLFMQMNNKTYGFTMALHEYLGTVPSLWETTKEFVKKNPEYVAKRNGMHFLTDEPERFMDPGWNLCHFWSNFEIGDLRFWRGKEYSEYFDHLDKAGGFFYERWGDAPVHSIAAILFLDKARLHHFDDIGYYHVPWNHCPTNPEYHANGRCSCDPGKSFDREGYSCLKQWWNGADEKEPLYVVPRTLTHPDEAPAL